jgi:hypothetical protein
MVLSIRVPPGPWIANCPIDPSRYRGTRKVLYIIQNQYVNLKSDERGALGAADSTFPVDVVTAVLRDGRTHSAV